MSSDESVIISDAEADENALSDENSHPVKKEVGQAYAAVTE